MIAFVYLMVVLYLFYTGQQEYPPMVVLGFMISLSACFRSSYGIGSLIFFPCFRSLSTHLIIIISILFVALAAIISVLSFFPHFISLLIPVILVFALILPSIFFLFQSCYPVRSFLSNLILYFHSQMLSFHLITHYHCFSNSQSVPFCILLMCFGSRVMPFPIQGLLKLSKCLAV